MEKTRDGYKFPCKLDGHDCLELRNSIAGGGELYITSTNGAKLNCKSISDMIIALERLRDTGNIHPPEKTEVEELKEQVETLKKQVKTREDKLEAIRAYTSPGRDEFGNKKWPTSLTP